jgi:hypothetical protein
LRSLKRIPNHVIASWLLSIWHVANLK